MFLPRGKAGVEGALEAFAEANKEGALKTKPKVRHTVSEKHRQCQY